MKEFHLKLLAADRDFYEGPCESLLVPLSDGYLGIEAGHTDLMGAVIPGEVHMKIKDYERFLPNKNVIDPSEIMHRTDGVVDVVVSTGLLKVQNGDVLILVDSAELPHEIDEVRARKAQAMHKEEAAQDRGIVEHRSAEVALSRAMARLNAKHRHFG